MLTPRICVKPKGGAESTKRLRYAMRYNVIFFDKKSNQSQRLRPTSRNQPHLVLTDPRCELSSVSDGLWWHRRPFPEFPLLIPLPARR